MSFSKRLKRIPETNGILHTGVPEADKILNDLDGHPHAFLLGVIGDRQMRADRSWLIPWKIFNQIGSTDFRSLETLTPNRWKRIFLGPPSLHRFPEDVSQAYYSAVKMVSEKYNRNASNIWTGNPASAELVSRFLEFDGIGPKLATMAVNLLATRLNVPLADYYSVDISADLHVRRVFSRLGLVPERATTDQIIYRARALNPRFPGALDRPAFEVGRRWCRPKKPLCTECVLESVCPSKLG